MKTKINNIENLKLKKIIESMNYKNGIYIYPKEIYFKNTDNNIISAAKLLNTSLNQEVIKPSLFLKDFRHNMDNFFLFKNPIFKNDYEMLLKTNKSNGKKLKWNVIFVQPNHSFSLHIHPNIEYEYSPFKNYSLYEYRYINIVNNNTNIKNIQKKEFKLYNNNIIINPINSMHYSYSKKNYTVFLVLWSGIHIHIPKDEYPIFFQKLI